MTCFSPYKTKITRKLRTKISMIQTKVWHHVHSCLLAFHIRISSSNSNLSWSFVQSTFLLIFVIFVQKYHPTLKKYKIKLWLTVSMSWKINMKIPGIWIWNGQNEQKSRNYLNLGTIIQHHLFKNSDLKFYFLFLWTNVCPNTKWRTCGMFFKTKHTSFKLSLTREDQRSK